MATADEVHAFLSAYVRNWNEPGDDLGEIFHSEGSLRVPGNDAAMNVGEAEAFVGATKSALPDIRIRLLSWAERDGELFTEWEMSATIGGSLRRWQGINKNRLRGAKSIEAVSHWDRLALFESVDPNRPRESVAEALARATIG